MSYQSLGLRNENTAAALASRYPATRDDHAGVVGNSADLGTELAHLDVVGRKSGGTQVHDPEAFACVERDRDLYRLVTKFGQRFELHDRRGNGPIRGSAADPAFFGDELGVTERPLEPRGVHRPAGDLEVDLYVDFGRSGM